MGPTNGGAGLKSRRRSIAAAVAALFFASQGALAGPLDTVVPGRWFEFPNSRMDSVAAAPGANAVMFAWGSGVYDTDRERLVVWGGGHTDYNGNEVYAFGPLNAATPRWQRLTEPSAPVAQNTMRGADQRPVSRHTYNLLTYLPAPFNKMMSCAIGSRHFDGNAAGGVDFYDFTIDGRSGQPWSAGPTAPVNGFPGAFCIYNPLTQSVWYQPTGGSTPSLQEYSLATNTWKTYGAVNEEREATPAVDTRRNIMLTAGGALTNSSGALVGTQGVLLYDMSAPAAKPIKLITTGPKTIENSKYPGFVYDTANDQFVGWSGGTAIFTLKPPAGNPKTGTWVWSQLQLDPGNTVVPTQIAGPKSAGFKTGTFGRFRYVPSQQGVVVVNATDESVYFFKIANGGGEALPTVNITADPLTVSAGGTTTLNWSTTKAVSCSASGAWTGTKGTSGSEARGPLTSSSNFILTCDNGKGGTGSSAVTVAPAQAIPVPVVDLNASPSAVEAGGSTSLNWTSTGASSCVASGGWSGTKSISGSQNIAAVTQPTTFVLTCSGTGGTMSDATTVNIGTVMPTPIVNISADVSSVTAGGTANLTWNSSSATSCVASDGWTGVKAVSGKQAVGPLSAAANFVLSCTGPTGIGSASVSVAVGPTLALTASAPNVAPGNNLTLRWNSSNAASCAASNAWTGARGTSGTETVTPMQSSTYVLTCKGAAGSIESVVSVVVSNASPNMQSPSAPAKKGGGGGAMDSVTLLLLLVAVLWRHRRQVRKYVVGAAALGWFAGGTQAADLTTVVLQSQSSAAQSDVPFTFGQVFKVGEVPSQMGLNARLADGSSVPLQVDAKATHADGSLRHAVLTGRLSSLAANGSQLLTVSTGPLTGGPAVALSALLATSYNATVSLNLGGTVYTASAREALGGSGVRTWLSGPLASEWIAVMPVKTAGGANHPHLTAYFHVRAYAGVSQVRTDVVVENNWSFVPNPGNFAYTATVTVPGKPTYTKTLTHYGSTRWHKRFWWGTEPQLYAKLDKVYLQDTKAIPKYENVQPTESFLNSVRRSTEPMSNGDQSPNMDDTGFQPGIGPLPKWDAVYAVSTDVRAFDYMLANADGGTAYSIHFRDEKTGLPISIDNFPNTSFTDPRGSSPALPSGARSIYNEGQWSSHQPSIGYLPYVVTGDYFYLEEAQFWSAYNLIWTSPRERGGSKGWFYTSSLRGQAWAYRSLAQSAYITPDNHPYKSYLLNKLLSNIQHDISLYVSPGGPHKNNLGAMFMAEGNDEYRFYDYFMSWAVQYLIELGFNEAVPFRDYKVKFPIGIMGNGANEFCFQAAAQYTWHAGPAGTSTFYPDFRTMYLNTVPGAGSIGCGTQALTTFLGKFEPNLVGPSAMIGEQDSTTYYFANLQPALAAAYDSGVIGGKVAWERSRASGKRANYSNNPIFAVTPRALGTNAVNVSISANPPVIAPGGSSTLSWTSSNAESCMASGDWAGNKPTSGSQSFTGLQANQSYVLTCSSNTMGTSASTAVVTVQAGGASAGMPTVNLTTSPSVQSGQSVTLTWTSSNASSCSASGGWSGAKGLTGTEAVGPLSSSTSFSLSCSGQGGTQVATMNVMVVAGAGPSADPTPKKKGGGGGSMDLVTLLLLLCGAGARYGIARVRARRV